MNKRIGITGSSGFIGKLLVQRLIDQGYEITALTRSSVAFPKNVKVVNGDLLDDKTVRLFLEKADTVVHLAARQLPPDDLFFRDNVQATYNLVKNMHDFSIKHFIYLSTMAVFGGQSEKRISDEDEGHPMTIYGLTKFLSENICRFWKTTKNGKLTILRPFNVYGKDSKIGVVHNMVTRVKQRKPIIIYGDGTQTRDFLYVDDVVSAIMISLEKEQEGIFNLGSEKETTLLDLVEQIKKVFPQKVSVNFEKSEGSKSTGISYSVEKAWTILGWKAKVSLEEGLKNL